MLEAKPIELTFCPVKLAFVSAAALVLNETLLLPFVVPVPHP